MTSFTSTSDLSSTGTEMSTTPVLVGLWTCRWINLYLSAPNGRQMWNSPWFVLWKKARHPFTVPRVCIFLCGSGMTMCSLVSYCDLAMMSAPKYPDNGIFNYTLMTRHGIVCLLLAFCLNNSSCFFQAFRQSTYSQRPQNTALEYMFKTKFNWVI